MNTIFLLKSIHIIGFVAWFSGLFYLVRIFVYHREVMDETGEKRAILTAQFGLMAKRVYGIICMPAMIITWICGLGMLHSYGFEWFKASTWMHIKLVPLIMLSGYQGICKRWMGRLIAGEKIFSSQKFRLLNEVPTVLLFIIVPLAVYKNTINPIYLILSVLGIIGLLILCTRLYKSYRTNKNS